MLRLIMAFSKVSKLAAIHPIEKMILSILPVVVIGFTKSPIPIVCNILLFIILHYIAKNPAKIVMKFALEITAFAAFSSITFVFDYGWMYSFVILLKSLSAGMCLSFFALTTPLDDVFLLMSKKNWCRDLADIAKSMQRFLIVINDEYIIMYNAIKSRGGFEGFSLKVKNTGKMAGLLFVNTMKRWQDIKNGIDSRCYRGFMPHMEKEFQLSKVRFLFICLYNTGLIVAISILGRV